MKFTTHSRAVVTLSLVTLLSAPFATALQADKDAAEALTNLIDPPAAGTQQDQAPSLAVIKQVVEDLLAQDSGDSIAVFGESAGQALRAILEESSLGSLAQQDDLTLYYLVKFAPLSSLQFFSDLERSSRFQYEVLVRGDYPPLDLVGTAATGGASRSLYLDLLDRTIVSGSLDLEIRLHMAVVSLSSGLSTPLSRSLVKQNAEQALGKWETWTPAILDVVFPTPESISANLPERIALAALDHRASMETFEVLSSSPHVNVRKRVAQVLGGKAQVLGRKAQDVPRPIARRLALLYQLSSDPVLSVEQQADLSIFGIVQSDSIQLDIEAVTELIAKVGSKTSIGASMSKQLAQLVHATAWTYTSATPAQVELLYRTALASPNRDLAQEIIAFSSAVLTIKHSVAYFNATSRSSERAREVAQDTVVRSLRQKPHSDPQWASGVLDTLLSDSMQPGAEAVFLKAISTSGNGNRGRVEQPNFSGVLSALPSDRAGEALRWMAANCTQIGTMAFESPGHWKDAGPQMREIFGSAQSSIRAKLIAGAALVNSGAGGKADVDRMTKLLVELCKTPSTYEDVEWFLKHNGSGSDSRAALHWDSVTVAILQDNDVPDVIATEFALSSASESAEQKAVTRAALEAAEHRAIQSKGITNFDNLVYQGLPAMLDDPAMLQPNLVRGWITRKPGVSADITSVVLASGKDELIEAVMDHLLVGIASSDHYPKALDMADQLLRIPGDEPIQRLLEVTSRSGSSQFVASIEKRLAIRLRIREAALRWSNLASGGMSIDSAKARVLKLLDSPNSEVRIEAIYGLGTLGAIESLPRLIELIGSEHQAEREAAKETLKLLRDRSANANAAVTGSNELQSPKTKD